MRNDTPTESVVLFQDEKGPIAAKTYGGPSWCSVQSKIERAQKIKGILNVLGIYDHTNDKMFTHCYKKRNSHQFLDFIRRVDSSFDCSIKRIFLILDNISTHKAKKVREVLCRYHPRITLVFLPTRSPKLNLIVYNTFHFCTILTWNIFLELNEPGILNRQFLNDTV